jgi:hypothetical protein
VAAFEPLQQAAAGEAGLVCVLSILFYGLRTLAAQLLHAGTDRGEIIGNAGSGHVSSYKIDRTPMGLEWFMGWWCPVKGSPPSRTDGPGSKRKSRVRIEEDKGLADQLRRPCLVDRLVVESGVLEHLDHLCRDLVAPLGDRIDLRLERGIGRLTSLERLG